MSSASRAVAVTATFRRMLGAARAQAKKDSAATIKNRKRHFKAMAIHATKEATRTRTMTLAMPGASVKVTVKIDTRELPRTTKPTALARAMLAVAEAELTLALLARGSRPAADTARAVEPQGRSWTTSYSNFPMPHSPRRLTK